MRAPRTDAATAPVRPLVQAEDRAHRMGQTKPVFVYRLYTVGSIEAHMAESAGAKREIADALMELGERGPRKTAPASVRAKRGAATSSGLGWHRSSGGGDGV